MRLFYSKRVVQWQFLFLLVSYQAQAQDESTLDELIKKALIQNLAVLSEQTGVQTTQAQIDQVKARALPQVNFAGDYRYYIKVPAQVLPLSAFGGPEGSYTAAAFSLPFNLSSTLQVNQQLFNPALRIGLRLAKAAQGITDLQIVRSKEEVTYNVSAAYYNAQTAAQQILFLRDNMARLEESIRVLTLQYENKLVQGIDVDRLRLNRTSLETQIESLQSDYNRILNLLKFLTGIPQTEPLRVRTQIDSTQRGGDYDASLVINRSDLLLLQRQQEINELNIRNTKAGFLPTLSAYGVANNTVFAITKGNDYSTAIPGYWIGLQLNWSVFDGNLRKAQIAQYRSEGQRINLQQKQLNESIAMDIATATNQIAVQQRNLQTTQSQVGLAKKVYTQTQLQLKEGVADLTQLIQAENALRESQNNYLTALVRLRTAELDLNKATGNLLKNY
ncbi:TolC family protein [Spirosoma oryzicola]|uniref:TolC family protein n=1 Tax=Spirosoma oryzicola TaxID=2898794 RepID=UPI001E361221|nr:TolC family protein [Spirosoma oryzicola]UHG94715.1 TolC family protein [Spirosoma oryzicola]